MPSLSLTTALLGSGLSCAVLCYVMAHLRRLQDAPSVFGWWSLAFALGTLRFAWRSLQPWIGLGPALFGAESLHAAAAILLLMGVGELLGFRPGKAVMAAAVAVAVAWAALFVFVSFDPLLLAVPLHALAGLALTATAFALFREHRRRPSLNLNLAAPPFVAWGLLEFMYPLTLAEPWLVPWYFLLTQSVAILASIGLVVGALRRFQDDSRRAEERLATAFETMPAQLALFDAGGDLVRGNAAYHSDFGPESQHVPRPNLRFEDLMQRLSRQCAARPVETDESPPTAAPNAEIEFESTMPDGRTLMVRKASVPDGGSLLVAVDISAQIERERDLLQSARLLRATLDIAPTGIAAFAADGKIVAWNRRFVETIEFVATPPDAETTLNGVIGTLAHRGDLGSGAAPWDLASRAIAAGVVQRDAEIDLALPSGRGALLLWHALGDGGTLLSTLPTAAPLTRSGA